MTDADLVAHAWALLETNRYLTLATADPDGRPWASPVYFAPAEPWDFYWVSATSARHSRNLAQRPQTSLTVFDSTVEPYHGRAVYAAGEAHVLSGADLDRGLGSYPGPSRRGATPVTREDVTGSSQYRLYRVTATHVWVLCPRGPRQPCSLHGLAHDHRVRVA
ncbi:pyridoxamine 5'-phosphate oxidase family protein [Intrasporangium sp.]|uniref:pyridoxamine 5'-phosphate oxidase family protein n=1 Tax=Intrasporangium sp. TaxID=1925024 RepID=UPI00293A35E2|nr:pyridoxamine 5'-phosphate oxidase family protein [Intrasporangium sp.]MDV3221321.1 pyridoxamine 5'-phosphate oxidase family protein [Intrasporangium sp.]